MAEKAPWITYRPTLKVLDCTIRDGGQINNSQFEDDFGRDVYRTCLAAGSDTIPERLLYIGVRSLGFAHITRE